MRTPLIERLPAESAQLALFDEQIVWAGEVRRSTQPFAASTAKAYRRRFRRWREWCAMQGYQADPEFITSEKLREWTVHMVSVQRYAVPTVYQALRALELIAERAGVVVSVEPALGVLDSWRAQLVKMGLAKTPPRTRRAGCSSDGRGDGRHYATASRLEDRQLLELVGSTGESES